MNGQKILVTGGAGFVGSHLVDALVERGADVRVFDNLDPQVHGPARRPRWVNDDAELIVGDVRDAAAVAEAVSDVEVIYHLAAAVGVGQSMYEIAPYTAVNSLGTANLLQALVDGKRRPRLVVASSMSIYGEGRYRRPDGAEPSTTVRTAGQLKRHDWELRDADGVELIPEPTDEEKRLEPTSVYALTKMDQEVMCLQVGGAYEIPAVALRFFNIYGPRQALSNPYTGVVAIFSSRLLNEQRPLIFEDGEQRRDFVSVHDIVQSLLLAAEREEAVGHAFNIGSGRGVAVREIAETLGKVIGKDVPPEVTGRYRVGDIRHCTADITKARKLLGYAPRVRLEEGMEELVGWLAEEDRPADRVEEHAAQLAAHGLTF